MDTKDLRLFIALAEARNFQRAAAACNLSPSAASRAIRRLELQAGSDLFLRDNRSVEITSAGEQFLAFAKESLSNWQRVRQRLQAHTAAPRGELSLFCSVTAVYSVLLDILPEWRDQFPHIELHVHTGDQAQAIPRVLSGEEDLAIAAIPDRLPAKLAQRTLNISPLRFIAPVMDCPLTRELTQHLPIQWQDIPLIVSETGLARERLDAWFAERSLRPSVYAQVSGHEAIVSLVALGFGAGVVPELVIANSPRQEQIQVLSPAPELAPFNVSLVCLQRRLQDPLVNSLWQLAGKAAAI